MLIPGLYKIYCLQRETKFIQDGGFTFNLCNSRKRTYLKNTAIKTRIYNTLSPRM